MFREMNMKMLLDGICDAVNDLCKGYVGKRKTRTSLCDPAWADSQCELLPLSVAKHKLNFTLVSCLHSFKRNWLLILALSELLLSHSL